MRQVPCAWTHVFYEQTEPCPSAILPDPARVLSKSSRRLG